MALPAGMGLSAAAAAAGFTYRRTPSPEVPTAEDPEDMLLGGLAALSDPEGSTPPASIVPRSGYHHPQVLPPVMPSPVSTLPQASMATQIPLGATSPAPSRPVAAVAPATAGSSTAGSAPVPPRSGLVPQTRR